MSVDNIQNRFKRFFFSYYIYLKKKTTQLNNLIRILKKISTRVRNMNEKITRNQTATAPTSHVTVVIKKMTTFLVYCTTVKPKFQHATLTIIRRL